MRIIAKILILIIIISFYCGIFSINPSYASGIGDIVEGADGFIQAGISDTTPTIEDTNLENTSNLLYNTLLIVAIVVAVIVGLVIGIQFMTAGVAEKAKIKETFIPYIIGCVVVFGAFTIWKITVELLKNV